jgi:ribonucleotide reductase alpha subunit
MHFYSWKKGLKTGIYYLRRKAKHQPQQFTIEPEIKKIITKNAIKALGCSQEQTFQGFTSDFLEINPLNTLPVGQGIYVPIESMDISGMLKTTTDSKIGKVVYEKPNPNVIENVYKPYKGKKPFPMNKEFNNRLQGTFVTNSFNGEYGKYCGHAESH